MGKKQFQNNREKKKTETKRVHTLNGKYTKAQQQVAL